MMFGTGSTFGFGSTRFFTPPEAMLRNELRRRLLERINTDLQVNTWATQLCRTPDGRVDATTLIEQLIAAETQIRAGVRKEPDNRFKPKAWQREVEQGPKTPLDRSLARFEECWEGEFEPWFRRHRK